MRWFYTPFRLSVPVPLILYIEIVGSDEREANQYFFFCLKFVSLGKISRKDAEIKLLRIIQQ